MRVRVVIRQFEIFEFEVEQVGYGGVELHFRQRARFAGQLQFGLLEVVAVNMRVAQRVDEFARLQTAHLGNHHGQKRVAGDVERHAEEDVRAALVELAGQFAVGNVKLKQCVAGRQGHFVNQRGIPGRYNQAAGIGFFLDLLHHVGDLVDVAAVGRGPATPLVAVNRAQVAVFVRPFVPDGNVVVFQVFDVGIAFEEPQQLVDNRAQVEFFGGQKRETLRQIEAHLVAEHGARAGAGAVGFVVAVLHDVAHQAEILFHVYVPSFEAV